MLNKHGFKPLILCDILMILYIMFQILQNMGVPNIFFTHMT
jgi:hypothetical protein